MISDCARVFSVLKSILFNIICVCTVLSCHLRCSCHCWCAQRLPETSSCHLYSTCVFRRRCLTSYTRFDCKCIFFSFYLSVQCAFVRVTVFSCRKQRNYTPRIAPQSFKRRVVMRPNKRKPSCPRALTARIWIWICAGRQSRNKVIRYGK